MADFDNFFLKILLGFGFRSSLMFLVRILLMSMKSTLKKTLLTEKSS